MTRHHLKCGAASGVKAAAMSGDLDFGKTCFDMGVGVAVLSILKELDVNSGMGMLGIGLACLAIVSLAKKDES